MSTDDLPDCPYPEIEPCDYRYNLLCLYEGSFCAHKTEVTIFSGVETETYLKATDRIKKLESLLHRWATKPGADDGVELLRETEAALGAKP